MTRALRYAFISVVLIVVHTTLIKFLAIRDVAPDILVVWIVYLAIRRGQMTGMVAGFLIGMVVDLLAGQDGVPGLSALAKTVAGFVAGYFHDENKTQQTLGGYTFLIVTGVAGLLHHIIYFIIFLQGSSIDVWSIMLLYGVPATLYTVAVALLPMFAFARKYLT